MVHSHGHDNSGDQGGSTPADMPDVDAPEADAEPARSRSGQGIVDVGWLRPRTYRALGRPRVSTMILLIAWIGLFVLYLEVHPG